MSKYPKSCSRYFLFGTQILAYMLPILSETALADAPVSAFTWKVIYSVNYDGFGFRNTIYTSDAAGTQEVQKPGTVQLFTNGLIPAKFTSKGIEQELSQYFPTGLHEGLQGSFMVNIAKKASDAWYPPVTIFFSVSNPSGIFCVTRTNSGTYTQDFHPPTSGMIFANGVLWCRNVSAYPVDFLITDIYGGTQPDSFQLAIGDVHLTQVVKISSYPVAHPTSQPILYVVNQPPYHTTSPALGRALFHRRSLSPLRTDREILLLQGI